MWKIIDCVCIIFNNGYVSDQASKEGIKIK